MKGLLSDILWPGEAGLDADHDITSAGFYHLGSCEAEPERTRGPEHSQGLIIAVSNLAWQLHILEKNS